MERIVKLMERYLCVFICGWVCLCVCVALKNKNIKDKNNIPEGNYKVYSLG